MALQLLFFILLNLPHEAIAEALPQPNVTVDRLVMTETDSVTLNCSIPSHVSVSRCDFYIDNDKMSAISSCVETRTGSELLRMINRREPAEVKVRCFYTIKDGTFNITSSDSKSATITINNLLPPTLAVNPLVITKSDSVTLNCQPPSSVPVTECLFNIGTGKVPQRFSCLKTLRGADLLSPTQQSSTATIDVTCFYLKSHQSPKSNLLTISIQLPPPELTVNPQRITEADSVTVNCGNPSVSADSCSLYFIKSKASRSIFCNQTLIGNELLVMAGQSLPAEVELTCYYTVKAAGGGQHLSPDSNMASITIINVQQIDSTTSQSVTALSVTAGQTSGSTMKTDSSFTPSPTSLKPALGATTDSAAEMTSGLSVTSVVTKTKLTAEQKPSHKAQGWIMLLAPPVIGVGLGVVLLLGLLCFRRRSGKNINRRSRVSFNENFIGMRSVTNGKQLPVGDEDGYHTINYIPAADSATESVQLNTQESQNENPDVYHLYSTIPDEPAESTLEDKMYYTLQAH